MRNNKRIKAIEKKLDPEKKYYGRVFINGVLNSETPGIENAGANDEIRSFYLVGVSPDGTK